MEMDRWMNGRTDGGTGDGRMDGLFVCPSIFLIEDAIGQTDKILYPRLQTLTYTR